MVQIAIDGEWYDLDKWAKHHPGGPVILEHYQDCDATEVFYSLHSEKAIKQLKHMRPVERKEMAPTPGKVDTEFRKLAHKLKAEGWYERSLYQDLKLLIPILSMFIWGTVYSYTYPITAMFVLGVGMQQSGWLGHDSVHARNNGYCAFLADWLPGLANGFDKQWWSRKHNTHHAMTNHVGVDPDIDLMPTLFVLPPNSQMDHLYRKYQHIYAVFLYTFMFYLWRFNSIKLLISKGDYYTIATRHLPNYIWLACMPLIVSFGSLAVSGFLVAWVVVQSHEDEEYNHSLKPTGFVETQINATCDIICPDPISEYLFGGMQYQLAHHLFPTMPRYKYPKLQPLIVEWAKKQGLEYKKEGIVKMAQKHMEMLKRNANAPVNNAMPDAGWSYPQTDF